MPKLTDQQIQSAIDGTGTWDSASNSRLPYQPWENHRTASNLVPFLVSADRQKLGKFDYDAFHSVLEYISPVYAPVHQVRCVLWGGSAKDLMDVLVVVNGATGNWMERIVVIDLARNEQAGWYLEGNPAASMPPYPHPLWATHLPGLIHIP